MTNHSARLIVDTWNAAVPVGTPVRVVRDNGTVHCGRVKYPASLSSSGELVGWVEGISGYYLLDRIVVDAVRIVVDPIVLDEPTDADVDALAKRLAAGDTSYETRALAARLGVTIA